MSCLNNLKRMPLNYVKLKKLKNNTIVKVRGSFRLAVNIPHLHGKFNFAELVHETLEESLCHSCRTILICQGISLP